MDPFSMVLGIVFVSVFGSVAMQAIKARSARPAGPSAGEEALQREVAALRQRVAALEAIVTEPGYELKRRIEALEGTPRRAG